MKTATTLATLPYSTQWIDESDIEAVVEVLRSEWLTGGPALERFEGCLADYFGARRFATLQGLTSTLTMPFGVLGPLLAGLAFDEFGSYQLIFSVYAPLTAIAGLFVVLAGRPRGEFG